MSDILEQAIQGFSNECDELLQDMEDSLLLLENSPSDDEAVNAVFRAAHTIKGSSGVFGFDPIVEFTHVVENVLDKLRGGELGINSDLIAVLLECRDHIATLVDYIIETRAETLPEEMAKQGAKVHEDLLSVAASGGVVFEASNNTDNEKNPVSYEEPVVAVGGGQVVETDNWHISIRFGKDVLRNGMDPLSFIRYLTKLGQIVNATTLLDDIPVAQEMDPESCYLGIEIDFHSEASKAEIEDVFEFVKDDITLFIIPPRSHIERYIELIKSLPEDEMRIGEILVEGGALTEKELQEALNYQGTEAGKSQAIGEILVEEKKIPQPVVNAAVEKQETAKVNRAQSKTIRVDAFKLDDLINLVGELVIASASSSLHAQKAGDSTLVESISNVSRLVEEIRDTSLRLRMVQIGETFNRFQRVVRDVSKDLGKNVKLKIQGAETELDKTVVEKIGDPLMHLVRNSMDHGIESAEIRQQNGKPAEGHVSLNAFHDSGSIVIEVSDDGGGLSREKILNKAIEKGLVSGEKNLTDKEVFRLIFEAGFSTAEAVTNISGRGVGMDVVRKNIEALRGSVDIDSVEGVGTTIQIRLPLTLAIIDGFLVGVDHSSYVIPLDMVVECVEMDKEEHLSAANHNYISMRGEVLPFIRLREFFNGDKTEHERENIVVVQYAGQKAGLVVDDLMGEFQTVIKPLGKLFEQLKGVSGSTILGSGDVAVILDVPALINSAVSEELYQQAQSRVAMQSKGVQLH